MSYKIMILIHSIEKLYLKIVTLCTQLDYFIILIIININTYIIRISIHCQYSSIILNTK